MFLKAYILLYNLAQIIKFNSIHKKRKDAKVVMMMQKKWKPKLKINFVGNRVQFKEHKAALPGYKP